MTRLDKAIERVRVGVAHRYHRENPMRRDIETLIEAAEGSLEALFARAEEKFVVVQITKSDGLDCGAFLAVAAGGAFTGRGDSPRAALEAALSEAEGDRG